MVALFDHIPVLFTQLLGVLLPHLEMLHILRYFTSSLMKNIHVNMQYSILVGFFFFIKHIISKNNMLHLIKMYY